MAKQEKKDKPAIKGTWADIIKASVKGNPKPKKAQRTKETKENNTKED